jgi:hypothetical protein
VDAVSSNLNASWNDGTFARFLRTLHALTGKPAIGEFYMAAQETAAATKILVAFIRSSPAKERAVGFRNTLQSLLKIPCVVGATGSNYDEPTHGRYDGENFNFGLVDIHDRPYEALTDCVGARSGQTQRQTAGVRPDASQGVPPAPRNPLASFQPTLALKHWDRERGFVNPVSEFPLADLYVCWNTKAVYLGLLAQDVVEDTFYRDKIVRASDRAEWSISINDRARPIRARIGAGLEPVIGEAAVRVVNLSGVNGKYQNVACMELPAKLFGKDRLKTGDVIEFASTLFTHCRAYRVEWKGRFTLRGK